MTCLASGMDQDLKKWYSLFLRGNQLIRKHESSIEMIVSSCARACFRI